MTAMPGPNPYLVLADSRARHPLVATARRGRLDTHNDRHGGRTHHVPII